MKLEEYLKTDPKKKLIFDFDETLVHLLLPWPEFKKKLKQIISDYDPDVLTGFEGSMVDYVNKAVKKNGKPLRKIILKLFADFELGSLKGAPFNKELVEFCQNNQKKYQFYIWTSNMTDTVRQVFKKNKLEKIFAKIIGRDSVILTKPYPEGFYKIFEAGKDKKEDYLMIGDSINDKSAAQNAGIDYLHQSFTVISKF